MERIITHPGSAHKDDFLSACVLLATLADAELYRREPSQADLDDAQTFVIDVGMEYDPQRRNFDHHQDPALPCAFHLLMQHLGLPSTFLAGTGPWGPSRSCMAERAMCSSRS